MDLKPGEIKHLYEKETIWCKYVLADDKHTEEVVRRLKAGDTLSELARDELLEFVEHDLETADVLEKGMNAPGASPEYYLTDGRAIDALTHEEL